MKIKKPVVLLIFVVITVLSLSAIAFAHTEAAEPSKIGTDDGEKDDAAIQDKDDAESTKGVLAGSNQKNKVTKDIGPGGGRRPQRNDPAPFYVVLGLVGIVAFGGIGYIFRVAAGPATGPDTSESLKKKFGDEA